MMRKRIAFVTSGIQIGGAEKQLALLAKALRAHQFDPLIISLSKATARNALPDFDELKIIECDFYADSRIFYSFRKLRRVLRTFNPDIIQGWMYGGNIAATLAGLGLTSKIFIPSALRTWTATLWQANLAQLKIIVLC